MRRGIPKEVGLVRVEVEPRSGGVREDEGGKGYLCSGERCGGGGEGEGTGWLGERWKVRGAKNAVCDKRVHHTRVKGGGSWGGGRAASGEGIRYCIVR